MLPDFTHSEYVSVTKSQQACNIAPEMIPVTCGALAGNRF